MKHQVCSKLADLPPLDLPVDLNGSFRFLLLELIWTDQLPDLSPSRSASDWQFQIFTVQTHSGTSAGRFTPSVDLPVDLNGNF